MPSYFTIRPGFPRSQARRSRYSLSVSLTRLLSCLGSVSKGRSSVTVTLSNIEGTGNAIDSQSQSSDFTPALPLGCKRMEHSLPRPGVGRPRPRRPYPLRVSDPRGRAGGSELGHNPPQTSTLPRSFRPLRSGTHRPLLRQQSSRTPERSGNHPQPSENRRNHQQRARIPGGAEGIWQLRRLHLEVRRWKTQTEQLDDAQESTCGNSCVRCHEQGLTKERLPVCRFDDMLRL